MSKKALNLQLPFKDRAIRKNSLFVTALPREESALRMLWGAFALLIFAYLFFVSLSVVNVIARKEADDRAVALRSVVGQLESEFFTLSESVKAEDGVTLGLAPVSNSKFIHPPGAVAKQSARNEI